MYKHESATGIYIIVCSRKRKLFRQTPCYSRPTCLCAVEDSFSLPVELLSKDSAVVQVAGVDQAACGVFEEQITLAVILRLKQLELGVWLGCKSFLRKGRM